LDLEKDKKFSDRLNIERYSSVESEFLRSEDMKKIINIYKLF